MNTNARKSILLISSIPKPHETGFLMHGIEFELKKGQDKVVYFSIFNALEKNGVSGDKVEQDDQIKRIKMTGYLGT